MIGSCWCDGSDGRPRAVRLRHQDVEDDGVDAAAVEPLAGFAAIRASTTS
jgi:hypothetical protein